MELSNKFDFKNICIYIGFAAVVLIATYILKYSYKRQTVLLEGLANSARAKTNNGICDNSVTGNIEDLTKISNSLAIKTPTNDKTSHESKHMNVRKQIVTNIMDYTLNDLVNNIIHYSIAMDSCNTSKINLYKTKIMAQHKLVEAFNLASDYLEAHTS